MSKLNLKHESRGVSRLKLCNTIHLNCFTLQQSKVYEAKNALVSTQAAGRPKYGAYNEANAKLVTAEGNYPSNYEHYSGFEPRKTKKMGILKGTIEFSLILTAWKNAI